MGNHPTKKIVMKSATVDKGIVPIVRFINGFDGIRTIWSCQGDSPGAGNPQALPYVTFAADDMESLRDFLQALTSAPCEVVVEYHNDLMPFWFHLRFLGVDHMQDFMRCAGLGNS